MIAKQPFNPKQIFPQNMERSTPPNFLDLIPETESIQLLSFRGKDKERPSNLSTFRKSDFRNNSLSTASTAIPSYLDVPDVFNHSGFRIKKPIVGSQLFFILFQKNEEEEDEEDSEDEERSETLYTILTKNKKWEIEDFEIYLEDYLNKDLHRNPLLKHSFLDNEKDIHELINTSRNFSSRLSPLLTNLKTFIEIKHPIYCATMRFGLARDDSLSAPNLREILSYILIFYWSLIRDKNLIDKLVDRWSQVSTTKTISSFYEYIINEIKEPKSPAF